ncbi:MAG: adenylate kinase [Pirellulales bacterium]
MWLVFIGPPGAGKGTQAEWLVDHFSIAHLSTGDMLRQAIADQTEIGLAAKKYMDLGELVPDEVVVEIIRQRLQDDDCHSGALFDGFPRTIAQAESLDSMLAARGTPLDVVLELTVDEGELERRLLDRGRKDDQPDVIHQRLEVYRNQTAPLLQYYQLKQILRTIEGSGTVAEVTERIKGVVN